MRQHSALSFWVLSWTLPQTHCLWTLRVLINHSFLAFGSLAPCQLDLQLGCIYTQSQAEWEGYHGLFLRFGSCLLCRSRWTSWYRCQSCGLFRETQRKDENMCSLILRWACIKWDLVWPVLSWETSLRPIQLSLLLCAAFTLLSAGSLLGLPF